MPRDYPGGPEEYDGSELPQSSQEDANFLDDDAVSGISGISRRDVLKILGGGALMALLGGCKKKETLCVEGDVRPECKVEKGAGAMDVQTMKTRTFLEYPAVLQTHPDFNRGNFPEWYKTKYIAPKDKEYGEWETRIGRTCEKKGLIEAMNRTGAYIETFKKIFKYHQVPEYFIALMIAESGGNPSTMSGAGAYGLSQFMPRTADHMGLLRSRDSMSYYHSGIARYVCRGKDDEGNRLHQARRFSGVLHPRQGLQVILSAYDQRRNPFDAADGMARYLKWLHGEFGNWSLAFFAYNAGIGTVQKRLGATRMAKVRALKAKGGTAADFKPIVDYYMNLLHGRVLRKAVTDGEIKRKQYAKENLEYVGKFMAIAKAFNERLATVSSMPPAEKAHYKQKEMVSVMYNEPHVKSEREITPAKVVTMKEAGGTLSHATRKYGLPRGAVYRMNRRLLRRRGGARRLRATDQIIVSPAVVKRVQPGILTADMVLEAINREHPKDQLSREDFYRFMNAGAHSPLVQMADINKRYGLTHQVVKGETFASIANKYAHRGVTLANVRRINADLKVDSKGVLAEGQFVALNCKAEVPDYGDDAAANTNANADRQVPMPNHWKIYVPKKYVGTVKRLMDAARGGKGPNVE